MPHLGQRSYLCVLLSATEAPYCQSQSLGKSNAFTWCWINQALENLPRPWGHPPLESSLKVSPHHADQQSTLPEVLYTLSLNVIYVCECLCKRQNKSVCVQVWMDECAQLFNKSFPVRIQELSLGWCVKMTSKPTYNQIWSSLFPTIISEKPNVNKFQAF